MLYSSLSQPLVFIAIFCAGLGCGILFDLLNIVVKGLKNNKIVYHAGAFFCTLLCAMVYYFLNLNLNYGEARFYTIVVFVVAIILERIISLLFIAKLAKKCYYFLHERKNKKNS